MGNAEPQQYTKYSLSVIHSQNNHYPLTESDQLQDFIHNGQYKHYRFNLPDATDVKNVTFRMNTLHGDADLYVSRTHKKPNKHDYEKNSLKITGMLDQVNFDNGTLATSYYIGVYGYQYSTYTLMVQVDRKEDAGDIFHVPLLLEGVSHSGRVSGL